MRTKLVAMTICAVLTLHAESRKEKIIRRTSAIAACALSAVDGWQTVNYAGRYGIVESNPIYGNPVNRARMIGFKAGLCAAELIVPEVVPEKSPVRPLAAGLNGGTAALYGFVVWHNQRLFDRQKALYTGVDSGILK